MTMDSTDAGLRAEIQLLAAEREIRSVLARYCRGIDRMDAELVRSVYHPDAHDDHIVFSGDVDAFVEWTMGEALPSYTWSMHQLGTCVIEVVGDVAHAETYAVCHHGLPESAGANRMYTIAVRYVDRFETRDGGPWLIADRVVVPEWRSVDSIEAPRPAAPGAVRGRRDRQDVAYRR